MCTQSDAISATGVQKIIDHKCIVSFRPIDDWNGENGFDWYRSGDTEEIVNGVMTKSDYRKDGTYKGYGGQYYTAMNKYVVYKIDKLEYLYDEYDNKKRTMIRYPKYDKPYIVPWISTFAYRNGKYFSKVRIKLVIHAENVKIIRLFVGPDVIKVIKGNGDFEDYMEIDWSKKTSLEIIAQAEFIDGKKSFAGQANIVEYRPNDIIICFIPIIVDFDNQTSLGKPEIINNYTKSVNTIKKIMAQVQIRPFFKQIIELPPKVNNIINNIINDFKSKDPFPHVKLDREFFVGNKKEKEKLEQKLYDAIRPMIPNNWYVVFLINQKIVALKNRPLKGRALDIPSKSIVVSSCEDDKDEELPICHELFHCLGLYHSFDKDSRHIFKFKCTSNIMDYSKESVSLWKWQWDIVKENVQK